MIKKENKMFRTCHLVLKDPPEDGDEVFQHVSLRDIRMLPQWVVAKYKSEGKGHTVGNLYLPDRERPGSFVVGADKDHGAILWEDVRIICRVEKGKLPYR